jgi:asparagine synthase (glutamine-hydrolysing)
MCGIVAVLGIANGCDTIKAKVLERSSRIRHRGPDWRGVYAKGQNIIAHERLAIVDVQNG